MKTIKTAVMALAALAAMAGWAGFSPEAVRRINNSKSHPVWGVREGGGMAKWFFDILCLWTA